MGYGVIWLPDGGTVIHLARSDRPGWRSLCNIVVGEPDGHGGLNRKMNSWERGFENHAGEFVRFEYEPDSIFIPNRPVCRRCLPPWNRLLDRLDEFADAFGISGTA